MSMSDCIQIIENRFYSNSNLVLQYNNNNKNEIKNEPEEVKSSFYPTLKEKSSQLIEVPSHESILQYQKSLEKCQIQQNSQIYTNDQFNNNSNFDYKLRENTATVKLEHQNSFLNSPTRMENISNIRTNNRIDNGESILTDVKGPVTKKCKVCSDKAVNQNFGVLSCESCKAFFRRNAIRTSPLKCSNGTDLCNVTSSTRKQCPSCRLKKCLFVGMRSELIQIRKNNPKVNSNKRKSNTISQDGSQPKWMNRNSNGSNSSGRLSQDNNEEILNKNMGPNPFSTDINTKSHQNESTIIPSTLWLDPNSFPSQINNQSNFWVSMNNPGNCDAIKANIIPTNYMSSMNTQSVNSLSQSFDPIKYDLQIPMIKIKTSQNVLQPIALLPAIQGSLYTTPNIQTRYSNNDVKLEEFTNDPLLSNEVVTELSMQTFYQTNGSSYTLPNNNSKSFGSSNPSAFYPFNIQTNTSSTPTIYYNGNSDIKNNYLWDCCTMPTSDSSINTDHSSFISMDSGSDPFYSSHTYPDSSSSSQKYYLSPDKYESSDNNPCFMTIKGNEDGQDSDLPNIITNNDLNTLFNSVPDSLNMKSNEHEFILQIGHIWEKTLGKLVLFANPKNIKVNIDLKSTHYGSLDSLKSLTTNHNWEIEFINLSEIFLRQLKLFLTEIIELINWDVDFLDTLKTELKDQLDNHVKTPLLVLMPVVFSNFIPSQLEIIDDNLNLDKEVETYLFQDSPTNIGNSESYENVVAKFSVENDDKNGKNISSHIDLSLLSNRLLDLNNINYSSLQYLDKYCSGLCNFLSASPILFGLFSILKIVIMRTNIDYCDLSWNDSLLKRVSPTLIIHDDKIAKLIYNLKSIFLTACDIVQTDTIEQRLQSLDQFLSWGKSQFDMQWMDFFNDTIRAQIKNEKYTDSIFLGLPRTKEIKKRHSPIMNNVFSNDILNEFGYHYCDVFSDI